MKKLLILTILIVISFSVNAQQISDHYDAVSANRTGFSYTITVRIQKTADDNYTATLLQVNPDLKGYYDAYRGKLFTCSQLENACQPNNFGRLSVSVRYVCNGQEKVSGVFAFTRLNENIVIGMARTRGANGKFSDATNFILNLMGGTLTVPHTTEISKRIDQFDNFGSSVTSKTANSSNSVTPTSGSKYTGNNPSTSISNTPSNQSTSKAYPNKQATTSNSQLSEKINVNGQEVQVYQQGGKYYMVNADGTQHETTQQAYNTVRQASNKKITTVNNQVQVTATARTHYEATQQTNRAAHELQQAKVLQQAQRNAFVGQQLFSSFYAAQAATDSKARLNANSKLSGNYESVAQLNEEFNYKYNSISADVQEWTNAKNESLSAATSILTSSSNSTTQTVGLAAGLIGGLINEGNVEKEERERKAELKRQRDAEMATIEAKRKAALVSLRRELLSHYPEGGIPLSAHHITIQEVYFFAYQFNGANIENNQPVIVISEVFPLAKYNDDTWPYKNSILKELKQKMQKTDGITLIGYYTTKKLADDMRNTLVDLAPKANFKVIPVAYKGKPKTNDDNNDFWGDGQQKATENKEIKKEDFWGNPVKNPEKRTDKPVKQDSIGTKQKLDFWGNPIK